MKVETYRLKDWEDADSGLLVAENDDWILVKHIPVDYVVDGYRIYRKSFICDRVHSDKEQQIEKVLNLKKVEMNVPDKFKFSDVLGHLKWVEDNYGIFEFQDDDETELFYGKVNNVIEDSLIMDMIRVDGSVEPEYDYEFDLNEIRVISFETDYHHSISLLWEDKNK